MSDRLPYEEVLKQRLGGVPLPDEDMAWADMKRRLDDDDDHRVIPIWLRGCGLWGLIGLVVISLGIWWLFIRERQEGEQQTAPPTRQAEIKNAGTDSSDGPPDSEPGISSTPGTLAAPEPEGNSQPAPTNQAAGQSEPGFGSEVITSSVKKNPAPPGDQAGKRKKKDGEKEPKVSPEPGKPLGNKEDQKPENAANQQVKADTLAAARPLGKTTGKEGDSTVKNETVSAEPPDSSRKRDENRDSARVKSTYFSAGLALHQQLPVNGQRLTPYNAEGRKGSLADYIPSVYFRMNRNDQWFVQAEFRYGAPQYNREITFYEKGVVDTFQQNRTITSARLKKTFYHQLPVSFNYFVLPDWSLGAGLVWNRFSAAVSEQDVVRRNLQTGTDTVLSQGLVFSTRGADSNFVKSYFQALLETQYRWRRFTIGARYSFGLEPYLKFTLPGGRRQEEKNSTLQLFIRYELWRSKQR